VIRALEEHPFRRCSSDRDAGEEPRSGGGVFTEDFIHSWIDLKMAEVKCSEITPARGE
jgi:hypothetical protein